MDQSDHIRRLLLYQEIDDDWDRPWLIRKSANLGDEGEGDVGHREDGEEGDETDGDQ